MTTVPIDSWPTATLDGVRRLRVLAAAVPGVHLEERDLVVSCDQLWAFITDLERSVPSFDQQVTKLQITERSGGHLRVVAHTRSWLQVPFEADLEPGFLWMQAAARAYVVGLAAVALDATHTRYAHLEGIPNRLGARMLRRTARHVRADVDAVARLTQSPE